MKNKIFAPDQLRYLIECFTDLTQRNVYEKTPYEKWRLLKKLCNSVTILLSNDLSTIEIYDLNTSVTFPTSDNSFGQFLAKEALNIDTIKINATDIPINTQPDKYCLNTGYALQNKQYYSDIGYTSEMTYPKVETSLYNVTDAFRNLGKNVYAERGNCEIISRTSKDSNQKSNNQTNKKESNIMKNFDFGPCTKDSVRMSMYGVAVKNTAGVWVSYNPKDKTIIDVDVFNFDGGKYMFKMPVAIKDIMIGDVVIHNNIPMIVTDATSEGKVIAIDVKAGEEKIIIPTTNMFGFNFVTKIVSMLDSFGEAPTSESPFGNMLPFLMMSEGGNEDFDPMLMCMMMQGNAGSDMFKNPMMMYFLMKDKGDSNDMLPMMMMMGMNK